MRPPNIAAPAASQLQTPSQQQQQPPLPPPLLPQTSNDDSTTSSTTVTTTTTTTATPLATATTTELTNTNSNSTTPSQQTVLSKPQNLTATQVQQAPLALTTQPQATVNKPQIQAPLQLQQPPSASTTTAAATTTTTTTSQSQPHPQLGQLQANIQPTQLQAATTLSTQQAQSLSLATTASSTGPTALVLIPQHPATTSVVTHAKTATIATPITNTVNVTTAHVTLSGTAQTTPIQLQAPITTHVSNITPIPMTAHQQSTAAQPPLANLPPSSLPIVPINSAIVKSEPNKYICCLLDNGVRCDRMAGNASFSARIQKIVGTKKMNFALDPTVRHAYICEHHKAIITVAKKSTTLARDTKSNAKNHTINNTANTLGSQPNSNYNDLSVRQQQSLQHPVNMDLISNQNRLANNHSSSLNNMPIRQGTQIAYSHYQGSNHPNQVGSMDVMMSSSFDNTGGGDCIPSSSSGADVDLQQLQVNTLRRYKRHFRVQTRPGLNKMQLAESLKGHFRTLPIIEKEAITYFVYIVKCYRNKLDHNPKAD